MADDADPPRRFYGFKPKEFERVNETARDAPAPAPEPSVASDPGIVPAAAEQRIDVNELIRAATGDGRLLDGSNAAANRANDVHAILRENHAAAIAAGLNDLKPLPKRRSRRRRDYFILLAAGNGFMLGSFLVESFIGYQVQCLAAKMPELAVPMFFRFLFQSPAFALPAALMLGFSVALTWLMFGVMNDY